MAGQQGRTPTVMVGREWSKDELNLVTVVPVVVVGRPWEKHDVDLADAAAARRTRSRVAVWLSGYFAALTAVLVTYALTTRDERLMYDMATLAKIGLLVALGWACGPRLLKMISGVKFSDPDD